MTLATLVEEVLGDDLPLGVSAYDGSTAGPPDPPATLRIRTPDALRRIVTSPGELGLARAYVAGDLEFEGDIFALVALRDRMPSLRLKPTVLKHLVDELGGWRSIRRVEPPAEEVQLHGRRHSVRRDKAAVSHHYDVSNRFYEMVLGPSMTYSCAVFDTPETSLEDAQAAKYELICRKLDLSPGTRLLDVGCGWGSMVIHAAEHHGAHAVGVTISERQAEMATKRVHDAGLSDRVEIRVFFRQLVGDRERGGEVGEIDGLLPAAGLLVHRLQIDVADEAPHGWDIFRPPAGAAGGRFVRNHRQTLPVRAIDAEPTV